MLGTRTYDLSVPGDGEYTFRVRGAGRRDNTGDPEVGTYTLDTVVPTAPVVSGGPPDPSNSTSPSWSFTHTPGATLETFECQVDKPERS
jgi:hypothetical protein